MGTFNPFPRAKGNNKPNNSPPKPLTWLERLQQLKSEQEKKDQEKTDE